VVCSVGSTLFLLLRGSPTRSTACLFAEVTDVGFVENHTESGCCFRAASGLADLGGLGTEVVGPDVDMTVHWRHLTHNRLGVGDEAYEARFTFTLAEIFQTLSFLYRLYSKRKKHRFEYIISENSETTATNIRPSRHSASRLWRLWSFLGWLTVQKSGHWGSSCIVPISLYHYVDVWHTLPREYLWREPLRLCWGDYRWVSPGVSSP